MQISHHLVIFLQNILNFIYILILIPIVNLINLRLFNFSLLFYYYLKGYQIENYYLNHIMNNL
jgi:hypothetical protein